MTPLTRDPPRRNRLRVPTITAPAALLVGLVALGVSVLLLGVLAAEGSTTPLTDSRVDSRNGTVTLSFPVPPYAPRDALLEVAYAFPDAPGDAYLLNCVDYERLHAGEPIQGPAVRQEGRRQGDFSVSIDRDLGYGSTIYFFPSNESTDRSPPDSWSGSGSSGASHAGDERPPEAPFCSGVFVALQWRAESSEENRPEVFAHVREVPLDSAVAGALFALAATSGILALAGGIEWGRRRAARPAPGADEGAGTVETLYRLAERTEAWLARTRRYVLISGPLGIFLWYPVLIPWAWRAGRDGSVSTWMPWALAGGALAFLAGLSLLWAREFLRIDRELEEWREKLARLKRKEEALLSELSG